MGKVAGMDALRSYLKTLTPSEQSRFAKRCRTSVGYIRKVLSMEDAGKRFGESLVIAFERESDGAVPCERMRPDVDWAYLRGSALSTTKRKAG